MCEACGPDCWDISPEAWQRSRDHLETVKREAVRTGAASVTVPQSELNQRARALKRRREVASAVVVKVLKDKYLAADCRSDWEWFAEEIPAASEAQLTELEKEIRDQPVNRISWWRRSFGPGDLGGYLEWIAGGGDQAEEEDQGEDADQEEDQEEEQPAPVTGPGQAARGRPGLLVRPRAELPSGSGPPVTWKNALVPPVNGRSCDVCRGDPRSRGPLGRYPAAILRAEAGDLQWMLSRFGQPMPELCGPHYAEAAGEYARDHVDGSRLLVSEQFDRTAVQQMRALAQTVPVLVNDQVTYRPEWR
jgi:hypothetical protein